VILLIPVLIFLFLKGAGENKFAIPVYYETGIPQQQQFDCEYPAGSYRITWPDSLEIEDPVLLFFSAPTNAFPTNEKRNIFRRIVTNSKTPLRLLVFYSGDEQVGVNGAEAIQVGEQERLDMLHCIVASDTLNQFILADQLGRIRGYYNSSLKEQDRLMVELKILDQE